MLFPTSYRMKPPIGTQPILGHSLTPTAAWIMNEGSGNKVFDIINGNHGTFGAGAAAPSWVPEGLSFDGGDYIDCGDKSSLKPLNLTISCWVYANTMSDFDGIIGYGDGGIGYMLVARADGTVRGYINDGSNHYAYATLGTGAWHHIALTFNGSTIKIYVDSVKGTDGSSGAIDYTGVESYGFWIGQYFSSSYMFDGKIKTVCLNNWALNISDISQLYYDPYCWLAHPLQAELMYAPPVGVMSPYYYETLMAGAVI